MKAFTTLAAAAALLSTSYAATVTIEETPCIQNNTDLQTFEVEIGTLRVGGKLCSTTLPHYTHTNISP
jgi:hypothetical protein